MSEFFSDAEPDLEDKFRQVQPLPAPVSPVSTVPSLRKVESPSNYPALAVPIVSSTVASVRSPGTMDAFPMYAGLSRSELLMPRQSPDAPGYFPMTSPVTPQRPEGSVSLLGSETPTLWEPGSLDSLLAYDISILDSAADLTQLALPLVPLPGDLQLLVETALSQLPVSTHLSPLPGRVHLLFLRCQICPGRDRSIHSVLRLTLWIPPLTPVDLPVCRYRMTSYESTEVEDVDPAYGLQLHHPRFLEFVGAPESACLPTRTPSHWVATLDRDKRCFGTSKTSARCRPVVI